MNFDLGGRHLERPSRLTRRRRTGPSARVPSIFAAEELRHTAPTKGEHATGSTLLQTLGLIALVAASASAPCEVYKSTDSSGKVQYSDRPPPGTALAPSKDDGDTAFRELQGTWTVANATLNGALFEDPKIVGATWSFRDNELLMEPRNRRKRRYTVRIDKARRPRRSMRPRCNLPASAPAG